MLSIAWIMFLLFFPACLALLWQVIGGDELSTQLLALGILLLCVDQARMAVVDLEQVAQARQQIQDARLKRFYQATVSTIALELLGFYAATLWLGWGSLVILLSQVWFNLWAGIQLHSAEKIAIQAWGIPQRLPVLGADAIGLVLVSLWMLKIAPLGIATGLLALVSLYGAMKYALPTKPLSEVSR
ncbi:hypothetical protein H6F68_07745 [Trichocoleus sp. FACHB-262]|nr:hypothetical protein [Trichocoleus sp. FACHB-262]